ncbi:MAG: hypothetical protein ACR2QX_03440 [Woeseiaceae bacterium]
MRIRSLPRSVVIAVGSLALLCTAAARAEPYLAVDKGLQCSACHSHPAGGGKRNAYGNAFAQTEMPAERLGDGEIWSGQLGKYFAIGGDLRAEYRYVDTPNQPEVSGFDVTRGTVYLEANLVPGRLSFYVDQQFAPGGSLNREAYVKVQDGAGKWHLAAGQFFLPYGLRLQDDTAFIREVTGVNFNNPDRGLQVGYESGPWSTMLSLTNGSGGTSDTDTGKQVSFIANYVVTRWRAGLSFNHNDDDLGDRQMQNLFFGVRTGPIVWLAEVDWINDDLPTGGQRDSLAGLAEANWLFAKGHNIKFSYDYFDPDDDVSEDHRARYSIIWEYTPMQFLQGRVGVRSYDGTPQVDEDNRDEFFLELHGFF